MTYIFGKTHGLGWLVFVHALAYGTSGHKLMNPHPTFEGRNTATVDIL